MTIYLPSGMDLPLLCPWVHQVSHCVCVNTINSAFRAVFWTPTCATCLKQALKPVPNTAQEVKLPSAA